MADEEKPVPVPVSVAEPDPLAEDEIRPEAQSPVPDPAEPAPVAAAAPRRSGVLAPLVGGALAAVAGFGMSHFNLLGLRADMDPALIESRFSGLEKAFTETKTAAEGAAVAATDQAAKALALAESLSDGQKAAAGLSPRLEALEARLDTLAEASPDGSVPAAAFAALKAEVDSLKSAAPAGAAAPEEIEALIRQELDARAAEITAKAEADAEALREAARQEAAFTAFAEAVRNGQPFEAGLADLARTDLPESLTAHAATGIPTAAALAESFPDAARAALEAALRADESGSLGDRTWSFLRIGTGARSLTPQEGSDPDAVLSRAEAAVKAGDLATALQEIEALPPAGQAEMADWVTQARNRIAADAALAALTPPDAQ